MVRFLFSCAFVFGIFSSEAQNLNVGMRIGLGVGGFLTTTAPRDYFIVDPGNHTRYQIRLKGGGELKQTSVTPPEVFISYTFKNRFFLQAGSGIYPSVNYSLYALDPEIEDLYNPDRQDFENLIIIPKDYIAAKQGYLYPYLFVGIKVLQSKAIKPFISVGVSPSILMSYEPLSTSFEEKIILKDIGKRSSMVVNGRISAGFKFYDLHLELYAYSNVTPVDSSQNSYNTRFTSMFLSVGYNFLSFNTVKKKRS